MRKAIQAVVKDGRVKAEVPPEWPDGTEVQIDLVCRPNLTAQSVALTGAEFGVIADRIIEERKEQQP